MIYFLCGFLTYKSFNIHTSDGLAVVIIIAFSSIACLVTLIRYRKSTFGYENEDEVNEFLIEREKHKKSSWFYAGLN
jgi:hypothetical protein